MQYRLTIDIDTKIPFREFKDQIRKQIKSGQLSASLPGIVVFVSSEIADTNVLSHDGKITTID